MVDVTARGKAVRALSLGARRPSGEPPPLPRHVSGNTRVLVAILVGVMAMTIAMTVPASARWLTAADNAIVRAVARSRSPVVTDVAHAAASLASEWAYRAIAWPTLALLVAFRRFQRLAIAVVAGFVVVAAATEVSAIVGRMRPVHAAILDEWSGYAFPAAPVAALALVLTTAAYSLVPGGAYRNRAILGAAGIVLVAASARVYLAVDHPSDALAAAAIGVCLPSIAFRVLAPDEVLPVSYSRRRRAHLELGADRRSAIERAVAEQMDLGVVAMEPFALAGSAGSTPLRMNVRTPSGDEAMVFAKLYATVHLRSDRWFKLARTVLYGRLEDERAFNTVRRLVEYEDHMLRVARDAGLPTPQPLGIVEITPEREYLLVTEFLDGASTLEGGVVDDGVIDSALAAVRQMWDAGFAHRDLKPANVLVRDGQVYFIDLAFAAIRPTPWRQAVDLANMMITLSLFADPERVFSIATGHFTEDEIAEAFAATRMATLPTQLRKQVRDGATDVVPKLRHLAPPRRRVAIQRWTVRRVALTVGLVAVALAAVAIAWDYSSWAGLR